MCCCCVGRWSADEHALFVEGLRVHGRDWKKIGLMIPTRTVTQIRTHAQKHFVKLAKVWKGMWVHYRTPA